MELTGNQFGKICGVTRQTIYGHAKKGKLVKTTAELFSIYDPENMDYLKSRGKSVKDVQKFLESQDDPQSKRAIQKEFEKIRQDSEKQIKAFLKATEKILIKNYGKEESEKIKQQIFEEVKG